MAKEGPLAVAYSSRQWACDLRRDVHLIVHFQAAARRTCPCTQRREKYLGRFVWAHEAPFAEGATSHVQVQMWRTFVSYTQLSHIFCQAPPTVHLMSLGFVFQFTSVCPGICNPHSCEFRLRSDQGSVLVRGDSLLIRHVDSASAHSGPTSVS